MKLSECLDDRPLISLRSVDALDNSVLSKSNSLQLNIYDTVSVDTEESPSNFVFVVYSRHVSSVPEPFISANISFRIICKLNETGLNLSREDVAKMVKEDGSTVSMCAAKASLLLSQLTSLMASDTPVVTPPSFVVEDN